MKRTKDVSNLVGISKRAIQYYDDRGLLELPRDDNNQRIYNDDALKEVWEILVYKEMGLGLEEIRMLQGMTEVARMKYLEQKMYRIYKQVSNLNIQMELIRMVIDNGMPPKPEDDSGSYVDRIREIKKDLLEGEK